MEKTELKHKLIDIISNRRYRFSYIRTIKADHELYDALIKHTSFAEKIVKDITVKTRIYLILNEISNESEMVHCEICNCLVDINVSSLKKFPRHCSKVSCKNTFKYRQTIKALKKKYGVSNPGQLDSHAEKCRNTKLLHYGDAHAFDFGSKQHKEIIQEKYGVDNVGKSEAVKSKIKSTCLEKYGVEYAWQAEQTKEKIRKTSLERYGVLNAGGSEESLRKIKRLFVEKYGDYPLALKEFHEKAKRTCLEKYGVDHPMKLKKTVDKLRNIFKEKYGYCHPPSKRYVFDEKSFDSSWELAYYIWLKDHRIDFEYHPNFAFEYECNGKTYRYFPDFKVENDYCEIKGPQFFIDGDQSKKMTNPFNEKDAPIYEAKQQCMNRNNIKIISSNDIKQYLAYVKDKYGKKYLQQFKTKKVDENQTT